MNWVAALETLKDVENLIVEAQQGSRSGLGALLESFRPVISQLATHRVGRQLSGRMSSSDLVQETFLTASNRFTTFRGHTAPEFRGWLIQVFQSRLRDGLRRHFVAQKRRHDGESTCQVDILEQSFDQSPMAVLMLAEESKHLADLIVNLADVDREIIVMRYWDQESFEAIARRLDMPVATVWRRWSYVVDHLRKKLACHVDSS